MFPLNLQRNIVQLDRQISLLENECKNLEMEKKKKSLKPESTYTSCSKNSNARLKVPTVRVSVKNSDTGKRSKKPTPPVSAKLQSTGSLPSHCSKTFSANGDASVGRKAKSCGLSTKYPVCSCQTLVSPQCNLRKESTSLKHVCCNEPVTDLVNENCIELKKNDHVLRFPNSGGTIEVTVTQKPNTGKENSPTWHKSPTQKSINSEKEVEKDLNGCRCQNRGQKWSEILSLDSSKKRHSTNGTCTHNKITDETRIIYKPQNLNNSRKSEGNLTLENFNNTPSVIQDGTFEVPTKLPTQLNKMKQQSEINSNKFEKEIQCSLEKCYPSEANTGLKDPVKIFQLLVNQFQQMSSEDGNKSPLNLDSFIKIKDPLQDKSLDKNNSIAGVSGENNGSYLNAVKHHCENLIKEKSLLVEELTAKNNTIATMKKREEEYLSLIASLKSSLEKAKGNAQEGIEAVKQMNVIKEKFMEQTKISEVLKKSLIKVQCAMENYYVESERLKTKVKIYKLEAQKHEILLAGKEAEIKRYKEEIQNFQQQISDHLTSLKSNAEGVDVEKMMEAIMHQSQIFAQAEFDSFLEKDQKDSTNGQNVLMHSSPTSTKTSVVNSSWKQISSIYDHDQSKENSEVIFLNDEDGNEKNFYQVFGENPLPESGLPEKTKQPSVENLLEHREVKNSSSFTSCTSLHDGPNTSKSTSRDSVISKGSPNSREEAEDETRREGGGTDKAQKNIEELLKNMKLKFSREIFDTSLPSCSTGDYLDISQISSISPLE